MLVVMALVGGNLSNEQLSCLKNWKEETHKPAWSHLKKNRLEGYRILKMPLRKKSKVQKLNFDLGILHQ